MTPIAPLIETFLCETLARQRGVSRHTRDSYALSFQLLFVFAAERLKVKPSALTLEKIDAGLVSDFLEYLEDTRKNAAVTRNVRLAAIKSRIFCGRSCKLCLTLLIRPPVMASATGPCCISPSARGSAYPS